MERFQLRVTTGGVVEREGKILMVHEHLHSKDPKGPIILTQPSGHLESNEAILDGLVREVWEETGYRVRPTALIGIYQQQFQTNGAIRFSFVCELENANPPDPVKDPDVLEALWLPIPEIKRRVAEFRLGATAPTFDDYFAGKRYPLSLIQYFDYRT